MMFDDNFPPLYGDSYSPKQVCDENGGAAMLTFAGVCMGKAGPVLARGKNGNRPSLTASPVSARRRQGQGLPMNSILSIGQARGTFGILNTAE